MKFTTKKEIVLSERKVRECAHTRRYHCADFSLSSTTMVIRASFTTATRLPTASDLVFFGLDAGPQTDKVVGNVAHVTVVVT